jgi:hypothetical protein
MRFTLPRPLADVTFLALASTLAAPYGAAGANTAGRSFGQQAAALPHHTYVNAQVLAYAQNHLGKQVGDGQCTALAEAAVAAAGGKPFSALGPSGPNADYVWGELITTITPFGGWPAAVQPGDIIQFRNVHLTMQSETIRPNGSWSTTTSTQTMTHHTAIISAVRGNLIDVLQQNINGILTDQPGTIWGKTFSVTQNLAGGVKVINTYTLNGGTLWVYRPYS